MSLTTVQPGMLGTPQPYNFKNRLINGAMVLDQRNNGASIVVDNGSYWPVDRWTVEDGSSGAYTAQQVSDAPAGFVNSLKVTATTATGSVGAGQYYVITQFIEGYNTADLNWGSANAQSVMVSFWVKASTTGQYSCTLYNSGASRINPQPFTISSANTWEYKTVKFTGDTTGTWLTTNGRGIVLNFYMVLGSNYLGAAGWNGSSIYGVTGQSNAFATIGNTFQVTGCQFEAGVSATTFDYRAYTIEEQLCLRYFYKAVPTVGNGPYGFGYCVAGNYGQVNIQFPVRMRTNPTLSYTGSFLAQTYNLNQTPTSLNLQTASTICASVQYNGASGGTAGFGVKLLDNSGSSISFDAEL